LLQLFILPYPLAKGGNAQLGSAAWINVVPLAARLKKRGGQSIINFIDDRLENYPLCRLISCRHNQYGQNRQSRKLITGALAPLIHPSIHPSIHSTDAPYWKTYEKISRLARCSRFLDVGNGRA
jgi:hypothetical protein